MRFSELPVHKLVLKVFTILIPVKNSSVNDGLCNRTWMEIIGLFEFIIKVVIITGTQVGNSVYISRIILGTVDFSTLPFILYRSHCYSICNDY